MEADTRRLAARLRVKARAAANARGHDMARFLRNFSSSPGSIAQASRCNRCGAVVHIRTHPAPNDIDIWGEAVAITCREKMHEG